MDDVFKEDPHTPLFNEVLAEHARLRVDFSDLAKFDWQVPTRKTPLSPLMVPKRRASQR